MSSSIIFFLGTESSVRLVDVDGDGLLDIITGLAMGREITTMIDESSMDKFCHKLGNYEKKVYTVIVMNSTDINKTNNYL